jgi:hypothetical protein
VVEDRNDLRARENDRKPRRAPGPHEIVEPPEFDSEHLPVEKQESAQRLILGRRADLALDGQMGEKRGHLRFPQLARMVGAMEAHEAADPSDIGLLGSRAVAMHPNGRAYLFE